jgi:hypothetical protein
MQRVAAVRRFWVYRAHARHTRRSEGRSIRRPAAPEGYPFRTSTAYIGDSDRSADRFGSTIENVQIRRPGSSTQRSERHAKFHIEPLDDRYSDQKYIFELASFGKPVYCLPT